ncbi:hypothetical protein EUX98_g8206 [Antrodiella citrinella]|uniref:Uncharacterized protein n=1 Tax=Antrodiella citrinella TaxID=2447956 RepID=A0A4V3XGR2_9APHY|nr:hypothetical protein EUX98_g8206 [Antrodiella citrinella]
MPRRRQTDNTVPVLWEYLAQDDVLAGLIRLHKQDFVGVGSQRSQDLLKEFQNINQRVAYSWQILVRSGLAHFPKDSPPHEALESIRKALHEAIQDPTRASHQAQRTLIYQLGITSSSPPPTDDTLFLLELVSATLTESGHSVPLVVCHSV